MKIFYYISIGFAVLAIAFLAIQAVVQAEVQPLKVDGKVLSEVEYLDKKKSASKGEATISEVQDILNIELKKRGGKIDASKGLDEGIKSLLK